MKETDWAYLAGLVDGEAHLDIYLKKMNNLKRGYAREYAFAICNTNLNALMEISQLFDNKCWIIKHNRDASCGWKPDYSLHFNHTQQRIIFPRLLPYLRIKKRVVELMLQSMALMKTPNTEDREKLLVQIDIEMKKIHDEQLCGTRKRDYRLLKDLAEKYGLYYY